MYLYFLYQKIELVPPIFFQGLGIDAAGDFDDILGHIRLDFSKLA